MLDYNFSTFLTDIDLPTYLLVLLGIIPTIATVASIARHFFGFKGLSLFVPIIMTIVFLEVDLVPGILFSVGIFLATALTRKVLRDFRMHYFVRVSFIYSIVCFLIFGMLVILPFIGIQDAFKSLFPVILLVTLVEEFFGKIIKEGSKRILPIFLESLGISIASYFIIYYILLSPWVAEHPWSLLVLFPINALMAGWEGLRLTELKRFKSVIDNEVKKIEEEAGSDS